MIPETNLRNLMLRPEVVEACEKGQFRIYAVSSIDEGISILTGVPAGEIQDDGSYPEDTVNALVTDRLRELAKRSKSDSKSEKSPDSENDED